MILCRPRAPYRYALITGGALAVVSIFGLLSSFASTPHSTGNNLKQSFEKNIVPSDADAIKSRRLEENTRPTNFFPQQSKLNEVKLDPEGILKVQKLSDANSTSPLQLQCSICGKLGVPLIPDNFISGVNATCARYDDYVAEHLPIESGCRFGPESEQAAIEVAIEAICCDQSELLPPYECEQNIRNQILDTYDTAVAPASKESRMVDVEILIKFQYLSNVDVTSSTIEFYANVYQEWKDPRLAWEVTSDACVTSMDVRASIDPEKTDIWTPAFDLVNKARGMQEFPDKTATIYSDGTVVWARGGLLSAIVTFVGLNMMPFDELGCQLHFAVDQQRVKINLMEVQDKSIGDNGFVKGTFEQSYIEHSIIPERIETAYYDRLLENRFHADIFFKRASRYYIMFTIFPNVIFVVLAFGQFFLDVASGERLSFGVTIVLIIVTQSIITSSLLPLCQEALWINTINFMSLVFTILCLMSTLAGLGLSKSCQMAAGALEEPKNGHTFERNIASYERVQKDSSRNLIGANSDTIKIGSHDKNLSKGELKEPKKRHVIASDARVPEDSANDGLGVKSNATETGNHDKSICKGDFKPPKIEHITDHNNSSYHDKGICKGDFNEPKNEHMIDHNNVSYDLVEQNYTNDAIDIHGDTIETDNHDKNVSKGQFEKLQNEHAIEHRTASDKLVEQDCTNDTIDIDCDVVGTDDRIRKNGSNGDFDEPKNEDTMELRTASNILAEQDSTNDIIDVDGDRASNTFQTNYYLLNDGKEGNSIKKMRKIIPTTKTMHRVVLAIDRMLFLSLPIAYAVCLTYMFLNKNDYKKDLDSEGRFKKWWY